jgi:hypothetical protein
MFSQPCIFRAGNTAGPEICRNRLKSPVLFRSAYSAQGRVPQTFSG